MPSQQNTYRKLDRDTAKNKVDKESMYDCRNMRLLGEDPNESGALVNILGNDQIQITFPGYSSDTCIGSRQIRDKVVLITTNSTSVTPSGTYGRIWTWNFKTEAAPTLIHSSLLNLSKAHPINNNIITRYESEEVQKVYWADGYNNLRYANIAASDIASWDPDDFNIVNEVDFKAPTFTKILGGKIPVGRVQYTYRLYKKYGPQTIFSPASKMINLTTENESAATSVRYGGADRLDSDGNTQSSGKSVQMSISNIDQNYDKIEIVAIHYSEINESPNIWIVQTTDVSDTIHFIDTGVYEQGYYSLAEYVALSNIFIPKTIATKNNIMFAGNVQTEEFDVSYDARAYRFRVTGDAYIYDSSGENYRILAADNVVAYGDALAIADWTEIPETFDCTHNGNDITIDPSGTLNQYQLTGSLVLGGEGPNVSYIFKTTDHLIDNSENDETYHVDGASIPYYFDSYASPFNSGSRVGYQRDEIYRFGIVFFSAQGQPSPVKWIGDIRMPNNTTTIGATDNKHTLTLLGDNYGTRLYLEFTVNNIPTDATGFQIVRVERKPEDRTVLFQGKMSFMGDLGPQSYHLISKPDLATIGEYYSIQVAETATSNRIRNLWISAPEVSFYKDYKAASGDYLQVIGYYTNKNQTSYLSWHEVNKYDTFVPLAYASHYKREVNEGFTQEAPATLDQELKFYSIAGIPFTNCITKNQSPPLRISDAGTGAIINLLTSFNLAGLPSSAWPVVNYRRPVIQYGGNSYEARLGNKYIPASEYIPKTATTMTEDCYGGDTFIQFFDHLHGYRNEFYGDEDSIRTAAFVDLFAVESTINLDLRHDDCWHRLYDGDENKYYLHEVGNASFSVSGTEVNPGWSDYYIYNTVFSRMENARTYIPVPSDYDLTKHDDALVIASNAKLNNEEIDAWSIWPINESLPLDGGHGPIQYLVQWNNILLFYQNDGFGTLSVLERSLIQDSEGRNLTLGEGDVLQRYDIISSEIGCSTRNSLIITPNGVVWYDNKQRRLYRLLKGVENLGVIKGLNSYFKNISNDISANDNTLVSDYKGFIMGYNAKFNEIWFTIKTNFAEGETLVFNEILDNFTGFIDNRYASMYLNQDDIFLSQRLNGYIYKENSEAVTRGWFYTEIKDAIVEVIINPGGTIVHTLTNLEFTTEVIDASGNNVLDETITKLQVTNDYQDTGVITITPGTNIRRLLRTWRYNQLRDTSTPARLRDTYSKVKITFTNTNPAPRKLILHDLISIFEIPTEAIVNKK